MRRGLALLCLAGRRRPELGGRDRGHAGAARAAGARGLPALVCDERLASARDSFQVVRRARPPRRCAPAGDGRAQVRQRAARRDRRSRPRCAPRRAASSRRRSSCSSTSSTGSAQPRATATSSSPVARGTSRWWVSPGCWSTRRRRSPRSAGCSTVPGLRSTARRPSRASSTPRRARACSPPRSTSAKSSSSKPGASGARASSWPSKGRPEPGRPVELHVPLVRGARARDARGHPRGGLQSRRTRSSRRLLQDDIDACPGPAHDEAPAATP